jgi:uncharacterized protein (DUF1684 family)
MPGKRVPLSLLLCSILVFPQCSDSDKKGNKSYKQKITEWRSERLKNLKSPDGWLNLAGLYWLNQGKNTLGSDSSNDVIFPKKAPKDLGAIFLAEDQIRFSAEENTKVFHNDSLIRETTLVSDAAGDPTVLKHQSLKWFVIKRNGKYGIRLRDLESPLLDQLTEIPAYPIQKKWKIRATFEPHPAPQTMEVPNVLGGTYEEESPGILTFKYNNQTYKLHPMGSRESLFVVFGDETNAEATYGGGRFLVVEEPDANNITHLDFNKAYNPPCAFTPYATCPLPPEQNRLPFRVKAGEKAPDLDLPHH